MTVKAKALPERALVKHDNRIAASVMREGGVSAFFQKLAKITLIILKYCIFNKFIF